MLYVIDCIDKTEHSGLRQSLRSDHKGVSAAPSSPGGTLRRRCSPQPSRNARACTARRQAAPQLGFDDESHLPLTSYLERT
jgi:hypothetical protein